MPKKAASTTKAKTSKKTTAARRSRKTVKQAAPAKAQKTATRSAKKVETEEDIQMSITLALLGIVAIAIFIAFIIG